MNEDVAIVRYVTEGASGLTFKCVRVFDGDAGLVREEFTVCNRLVREGDSLVALPFEVPSGADHEVVDD